MTTLTGPARTLILISILAIGAIVFPVLLVLLILVFLPGRPPSSWGFAPGLSPVALSAAASLLSPRSPPSSF